MANKRAAKTAEKQINSYTHFRDSEKQNIIAYLNKSHPKLQKLEQELELTKAKGRKDH